MPEAARLPCVTMATGAFAALPQHCAAVHARLWAPLERRIRAYQRDCSVDAQCAEKAAKHDDHVQRVWVKSHYGVDIEDCRHFTLALDASRLSEERLVEVLLAAAGVTAAECDPGGVALAS
jgi:cytidylate kinase